MNRSCTTIYKPSGYTKLPSVSNQNLLFGTGGQGNLVGFYITILLASILVLDVVWPVIDDRLNNESMCTTVTGETFNVSGLADTWISLANTDITSGSESVYNATYNAVGTDYNMDYSGGRIMPLGTGALNFNTSNGSTEYDIDYTHSCTAATTNMSTSAKNIIELFGLVLALGLLIMMLRPIM